MPLLGTTGGGSAKGFGAVANLGYFIRNSLRFRSSASADLSRTPTVAGNRKTYTFSAWVKRGTLGSAAQALLGAGTSNTVYDRISFESDSIRIVFNNGTYDVNTSSVYRDPSAWYHVVVAMDTTQATAANRVKIYVNGNQITAFATASYPAQNHETNINNNIANSIGSLYAGSWGTYLDGYMADINFIDGQALDPSYFGKTDAGTGQWIPKKFAGTYGTNGFYLKFADTSAATAAAIGKDSSGYGNNWTPNNISVTAGVTYDAMIDSPTNASSGTQPVGNYPTFNPLSFRNATNTLSNANLTYPASSSTDTSTFFTMALPTSNLFYFEGLYTTTVGAGNNTYVGVSAVGDTGGLITTGSNLYSYDLKNGIAYNQASTTSYTAVTNNQTAMFAFDIANGKMWVGANGTWFNSGNPVAGTGAILTTIPTTATALFASLNGGALNRSQLNINFGQRPFAYTPPTGYKALCTTNLPTPTIKKGNQYFDATLYTGNGSTQTITNAGAFKPDWIWIKRRNGSPSDNHVLQDSVRGLDKFLISNSTAAEASQGDSDGVTSYNTNGFTLGYTNSDAWNSNTNTYVGWQWRAGEGTTTVNTSGSISSNVSVSTTAGFSVVTYTGTGANATVGHGLGVAPKMVIIKNRTAGSTAWNVYQASIPSGNLLSLNSTAASFANTNRITAVSSTTFSIGTDSDVNGSTNSHVAYCFAEIAGFSKFGSYTGNGSADGTFVFTNFRPKWVMIKRSDSANSWFLIDTVRQTYNVIGPYLTAESSAAETTGTSWIDVLSNGFKLRSALDAWNANGGTYIYMAFAENPFKNANAR